VDDQCTNTTGFTQAELRKSREKFTRAFQGSPLIISISTLMEGRFLEVNDTFLSTLGYCREEVVGHTSLELGVWQNPPDREKFVGALNKNKTVSKAKVNMKAKDGRLLIFNATIEPIEMDSQDCLLFFMEDMTKREKTEEALRASEEKYRLLLENTSEAIIVIQDDLLKYFNPKTLSITGYSTEDLMFKPFSSFVHTDDLETVFHNYYRHLRGEGPIPVFEFRSKAKDNSYRWVEASGLSITWEGKPALLTLLNDITERKLAQEKLKHSEELFRLLAENAKDLIFRLRLRPEVKLEYISPSVLAFTGYTAEEAYLNPGILYDIRHGDGGLLSLDEHMRDISSQATQMHWQKRDGTFIWAEEQVHPIFDTSGKLAGLEGIVRDITGRKQAAATLADEATRRRILVDQSRDGIVVLDQSGKVYEANKRFAEMLGYSPQEVTQLSVWDWEYQINPSRLLEMLGSVDETGDHFETIHRRKDGTFYDVEISTNGAAYAGQKLIFCVCRDITERKHMEKTVMGLYEKEKKQREELQEEARTRGLFIDVLAHELRTPLTPILSSTSMLCAILADDENKILQRLAVNIQNSAQTLAGRLEELLEVARYSRGTFKLRKEQTDINGFIEGVITRFKPTLEPNKQQLKVLIPEKLPPIAIDQSRIEQVLINLLSNAGKFAPGTDITLEIKTEADQLVFNVIDTGIGITVEEQAKIFQPYHRVEQDRQKFPGIGLGLAVCKQIIEAHNGTIGVKSERGKGSTFSFSLPVNAP
jgi:PAS domain S-box-containing protein